MSPSELRENIKEVIYHLDCNSPTYLISYGNLYEMLAMCPDRHLETFGTLIDQLNLNQYNDDRPGGEE